jgi:hypothetical protein
LKLLFLHHQQRFDYRAEPGYNELFRPLTKARQVTGWSEFVYQTLLRQFLIYELALRGKKADRNPTQFIMQNLDAESYGAANLALQPILEQVIASANPDIIIYSLTWGTEAIHPVILGRLKTTFPKIKLFAQQWDYEEGAAFFHSVERGTIAAADCYSVCDNHDRLRRIQAYASPHYGNYTNVDRVRWLPTVLDPDLYRPLGMVKDIDILIIGSSEGYRRDVITALQHRYGGRFQHLGGHMPWDKMLTVENYVEAINCAKIVVNTQTAPQRVQVKGRVREVLSCGGFLLEQDNAESREFLAGSDVVFFSGLDALFSSIDVYLANDAERDRIARSTHEWYRSCYTPDLAMQRIIDAVRGASP